jgi:hypothetical protein
MSLAINVDHVSHVLLADGRWHEVKDKSFRIVATNTWTTVCPDSNRSFLAAA